MSSNVTSITLELPYTQMTQSADLNAIKYLLDVVEQEVCMCSWQICSSWCYHVKMDQNLWEMFL